MKNGKIKTIAVTGGAGQIAYSLLFRLAAGELFGKDQKIALRILEIPTALDGLKGVVMELEDCAFPLIEEISFGSDPKKIFKDVDCAFLVGARPRGPGMERKDLLLENAKIFVEQGRALEEVASQDVLVLVIGNPCNTNCLIARSSADRLSPKQFFAMTRLDQNRAQALLAKKAGVPPKAVSHIVIWGNHSSTQVPDFIHAQISGLPVMEVLKKEEEWLKTDFFDLVQKRGAEVIAARGKSSAASAAQAALDAMTSLLLPSKSGEWFSMGVGSEENPYGIDPGLVFSFPCQGFGGGKVAIAKDLVLDPFLQEKIAATEKELKEERAMVQSLLKQ